MQNKASSQPYNQYHYYTKAHPQLHLTHRNASPLDQGKLPFPDHNQSRVLIFNRTGVEDTAAAESQSTDMACDETHSDSPSADSAVSVEQTATAIQALGRREDMLRSKCDMIRHDLMWLRGGWRHASTSRAGGIMSLGLVGHEWVRRDEAHGVGWHIIAPR